MGAAAAAQQPSSGGDLLLAVPVAAAAGFASLASPPCCRWWPATRRRRPGVAGQGLHQQAGCQALGRVLAGAGLLVLGDPLVVVALGATLGR
jgi:hypothetical protein